MRIQNPTYRPESLPLGAVILTDEYQKLNPSQQKFVVRYIDGAVTNGVYDATAAIHHAYGSATKNADLRAYQMLRNRTVKKVLDQHFRRSELDILLSDLQRAAKKSRKLKLLTPAAVKALIAFEAYVAKQDAAGLVAKEKS